jgi:hypothetical protein
MQNEGRDRAVLDYIMAPKTWLIYYKHVRGAVVVCVILLVFVGHHLWRKSIDGSGSGGISSYFDRTYGRDYLLMGKAITHIQIDDSELPATYERIAKVKKELSAQRSSLQSKTIVCRTNGILYLICYVEYGHQSCYVILRCDNIYTNEFWNVYDFKDASDIISRNVLNISAELIVQ